MEDVTLLTTMAQAGIAVVQAGIGAYLGYIAGIRTFKIQTETTKKLSEDNTWQSAFGSLGQILHSISADLNETANFKNQIVNHLLPEADLIDKYMYESHVNEGEIEREAFKNALVISQKSSIFFKSTPVIFPMHYPNLGKISLFFNEMPSLPLFLHYSKSKISELNERIKNRNRLIEDFSRETVAGIRQPRLAYYLTMLSSEAVAISKTVDAALGFQKLSIDQIEAFMAAKGKGRKMPSFRVELSEQALNALPPDSFLADFRKGLKTFRL